MIRLLVTGASGMIGSRFLQLLPDDFSLVGNIDRAEGKDILDPPSLFSEFSTATVDVVIHFAAFTDVNAAALQEGNENGNCYKINVLGTQNIIELCRRLNCHLIHISTDFVFDGKNPPVGGYTEDNVQNPIEWYGKTKFFAEESVKSSSVDWCIARTAYPFIASFPKKLDLVRSRIQQMKERKLPSQFIDHTITPTFCDELVQALVLLARKESNGIYHLAGDSIVSDYELSKMIADVFNFKNIEIVQSSLAEFNKIAKRPYQQSTALSNKKFEVQFGDIFSPLRDALVKMKNQSVVV